MTRPGTADPRAGFTFIEVLAALVVTVLIVTTVLPFATRLATRWWLGASAVAGADAVMQAAARLSGDLAQAVPYALPGGGDASVLAFRADAASLTFVCPALGKPAGSGLETVRYEIRARADGAALVRRSRAFVADDFASGTVGDAATTTLIEGPYRFRFAIVAEDGSRQASWSPTNHMPARVDLSVARAGRGAAARVPVPLAPIPVAIASRASAVPNTVQNATQ